MRPIAPNESDRGLEAEIWAVAAARSRRLPGHLSPDELVDYSLGELSAEETDFVQQHLSFCRECSQVVLDLAAFSRRPAGESERPATDLDGEWERLQNRLGEEAKQTVARSPLRARLPWALLAASVLTVLGLLNWNLKLREGLGQPSRPRTDIALGSLAPDKPAGERSAEALTQAYVRPDQRTILLLLNLGDLREFPSYRLELVEPGKGVLWGESGVPRNDDGTFLLEIPARMLASKPYRVDLFGQSDGEQVLLGTYSFEVVRREQPRGR